MQAFMRDIDLYNKTDFETACADGIKHFTNLIASTLASFSAPDTPLVLVALEIVKQDLCRTMPEADSVAAVLLNDIGELPQLSRIDENQPE